MTCLKGLESDAATSGIHARFQKDVELAKQRGKDTGKLKVVIMLLFDQQSLPVRYRDHWLSGNYSNRRECHIEPDWLLIYKPDETSSYL